MRKKDVQLGLIILHSIDKELKQWLLDNGPPGKGWKQCVTEVVGEVVLLAIESVGIKEMAAALKAPLIK